VKRRENERESSRQTVRLSNICVERVVSHGVIMCNCRMMGEGTELRHGIQGREHWEAEGKVQEEGGVAVLVKGGTFGLERIC
jgi:hypothetical protein